MAGPENIDSLKPEDVVVTSTPQQRKTEEAESPKEEPPKEEPEEEEEESGEEGEESGEEGEESGEEGEESGEEEEEGEEGEIEEIDYEALSEEVGIELDSEEAVLEALEELAEYRALSPALQKAIEIERNKGDVAAYFKAIANDPKDLSDRDVLWEQYAADNPKRIAANPKFARLDFDRKLDKEYALLIEYEKLSASDKDDFLEEHKDELEYLTEKRKFDAETARTALREIRDSATFKPVETSKDGIPLITKEQAAQLATEHEAGYKKALKEFDVVSVDVGNDFEFNVSLSESNKEVATSWMKDPSKLLQELGFHDKGIDYDTLAGWATLIADIKYGTFGDRLRQAILDSKDIQTLENTLDAPSMVKSSAGKPALQGDEWDQVGEAFERKRIESRKKR